MNATSRLNSCCLRIWFCGSTNYFSNNETTKLPCLVAHQRSGVLGLHPHSILSHYDPKTISISRAHITPRTARPTSPPIPVSPPPTGAAGSRTWPNSALQILIKERSLTSVLDDPEQFDDAPYVPPRVTQAELQNYPALDPRLGNVYDPQNHDIQHQYPYEGSPSDSHHSVESNWSNSSSSSASSQQLPHDYLVEPISQYPQPPLPLRHTAYQHYPAYQGQHRLGLDHARYADQPSNTGGCYYRTPQEYSIDGLLSPEIFEDTSGQAATPSQANYPATSSQGSSSSSSFSAANRPPNVSAFPAAPTPLAESTRSLFPDAGPYLRQQLGLSANDSIGLHSLPDPAPGEKPSTPLPMLVKLAIYGSPKKQLTLQEIYIELEKRFEWFREHKNQKAWKNSIRHNLSLNQVFQHVPRPVTEPGKGSYWQLDVSKGEGHKRVRKRRPKNRMMASEEENEEASEMDEDRPSPLDSCQHAGLSQSSAVEDAHIDPELRSEGHVVGEGRTRSTTRRAGGGSPYPSQSPRYQQGPLPVVVGQDTGQPPVRIGQPSFGESSFPTYPPTRPMPAAASSSSFATMSSSPMTAMVARPQPQDAAPYDRAAQIPPLPLRAGIEYTADSGGLPAARRVETYPESQAQSQGDHAAHASLDASSSGSSRIWNNPRSR
ncbi:hypothetical protein J3R82DRAFT_11259 [Butyriboletus roseoflavus]|nr:hypothetical protein J3R82DRAFT_11259 [Butyriboletus roseoflavus]